MIFVYFFNDKPYIDIHTRQRVNISVFIALILCIIIWSIQDVILDYDELSFGENGWMRSMSMNGCNY